MSVNKVILEKLYIVDHKSIPDVAKELNVSLYKARSLLLKNGVHLRTRAEGVRLASKKLGIHSKGKIRTFTDEWKKNMAIAARNRPNISGKRITSKGYVEFTNGEHKGRREHIVIMERHICRKLKANECVHHIDHNRANNNIENLLLMLRVDHSSLHAKERAISRDKKGRFI